MSSHDGSAKVIVIALFANLGIAILKVIGAILTSSASMLAEAIHSFVDCSNQVLLLVGRKLSLKPPTEQYPLGHGREAYFWSFMVAILLFFMGGLFAIYEGVHKFGDSSHEQSHMWVGLAIMFISIIIEGYSFVACLREVRRQNQYPSLVQWFRKTTTVDLLVIFTEDAAALTGLVIATACMLMAWVTQNPQWDAFGSIAVGVILVIVAILLGVEIKSLIVGEAPSHNYRLDFEAYAAQFFPEGKVLRFIALQIGLDEIMVSAKLNPGTQLNLQEAILKLNELEKVFKAKFPMVRWQFIEFDRAD